MSGWQLTVPDQPAPGGCVWAGRDGLEGRYALPGAFKAYRKFFALGGTHFCAQSRDRNSFPLIFPWGQNGVLNRALGPKGLAHSQRSISLYVSRPYAHVVRAGLF